MSDGDDDVSSESNRDSPSGERTVLPLSRNDVQDLGKLPEQPGHEIVSGVDMDLGEARSPECGRSNSPAEIRIKIWYERCDRRGHDQAAGKENEDELVGESRLERNSMKMMSLALGGQAVSALMANALLNSSTSSSSSSTSWVVFLVELSIVLGLSFTVAGISLHGKKAQSIYLTKIGALAMASAVILSLGSQLPTAVAWTVGSFACLITAAAVASA